ncbi:glucose-6-phosphate isomerase, partial [Enteropsectra breve]
MASEDTGNSTLKLEITNDDFILYDISKTTASFSERSKIKKKLTDLDLSGKIEKMYSAENVNYTEQRPALHHLLRHAELLKELEIFIAEDKAGKTCLPTDRNTLSVDSSAFKSSSISIGINKYLFEIFEEMVKIYRFCKNFSKMRGISGMPLDTVVSIGIGGSDLGPRLISSALPYYSENRRVFYVSNVDPTNMIQVFNEINPETTLFVVVSKTFTTAETIRNYELALALFADRLGKRCDDKNLRHKINEYHFIAATSNAEEANKQGIKSVFQMWDYIGGRYSLWSAAGISIPLYIGFENFLRLLKGASAADNDFYSKKENSIAAALACNELLHNECGYNNKCIVAYDSYLCLYYKHIQQLEMESNGKRGSQQNIIWGGVGTDVQHSFFQAMHQEDQKVLIEFMIGMENLHAAHEKINAELAESDLETIKSVKNELMKDLIRAKTESEDSKSESTKILRNYALSEHSRKLVKESHKVLISNCFAQSASLLEGRHDSDKNKDFNGKRPSVTILYSRLNPETLGALIAMNEQKVFVMGVYWKINSFDQFGVQLGKDIANKVYEYIETGE